MPHPTREIQFFFQHLHRELIWVSRSSIYFTDDQRKSADRRNAWWSARKARLAALEATRRALLRLTRRVGAARKAYRKAAGGSAGLLLLQQLEAEHLALNMEYWYGPEGVFASHATVEPRFAPPDDLQF